MSMRMLGKTTLAALLAAGAANAADTDIEARLHEEVQAMLVRLMDSGELRREDLQAVVVSSEPTRRADFGAIVDVRPRSAADGLEVLAVTPGGNAAALGLRAGDRIVAVDGMALDGLGTDAQGRSVAAATLSERVSASQGPLVLEVVRDGRRTELRGPVQAHVLPPFRLELGAALAGAQLAAPAAGDSDSTCGRISVFDVAPRKSHVYPAVLIALGGEVPGPAGNDAYRVRPGRHELTVAEAIDPEQFTSLARVTRDRRSDPDRYKTLVIDVQPGITYRLGAQFHLDERHSIRDGEYWDPVIYTEVAEPCR